jgi:hypothetical protein
MSRLSLRWRVGLAVVLGLLVVLVANAHLVWVALQSQPDCVAYVRSGGDRPAGSFIAAKPSC